MHKLVWTGTTLSDEGVVGAWSCPYTHSTQPPIIKVGKGTGSTPTLMGPAYPTCYGAERFQWNTSTQWPSVWARSDVSSTSMVPVNSQSDDMALINGYR